MATTGAPWTDAWEEAEASCEVGTLTFYTLELTHPAWATPVRIVTGTTDQAFTLEADAPNDPGGTVTFTAIPFEAEYAEVGEGKRPTCRLRVDNVQRELVPLLDEANGSIDPLTVLYREFDDADRSEPIYGPVEFNLFDVDVSAAMIEGTCVLNQGGTGRFPRGVYTLSEFPALKAGS